MSNIYIQEPPTYGKVLLTTTVGEIEVELWSKETPKACRNFIQLGLEGYYNGTIFHRIIKGFIAQGGDPTGTGKGGESVYGQPFKDEIHTRLRFNRRGLVALANAGKDDNSSQFFFTFAPTPELQNKHTIFGKVVGETLFNMLKLEDFEVDGDDRPVYPPKIIKVEILSNPFPDIQPREVEQSETNEIPKEKPKVAAVKNFKLLSFGDEAEEDEEELNVVSKIYEKSSKSTHDLLTDPTLSCKTTEEDDHVIENDSRSLLDKVREKLHKKHPLEDKFDSVLEKPKGLKAVQGTMTKQNENHSEEPKSNSCDKRKLAKHEYQEELNKYSNRQKELPKVGASRESQTLALLEKFKKNMSKATDETSSTSSSHKKSDWLGHTFKCFTGKQPTPLDKYNKFHEIDSEMYDITDPRNSINKRRREDSQKSFQNKRNPYHS